jgi:hypothetical protein
MNRKYLDLNNDRTPDRADFILGFHKNAYLHETVHIF